MGTRAAACLSWSTLALMIVLTIAYFPIRFQLHAVPITPNAILPQNDIDILKITPTRAIAGGFLHPACLAFATLGALIVTHQRRNMDEDHDYNWCSGKQAAKMSASPSLVNIYLDDGALSARARCGAL